MAATELHIYSSVVYENNIEDKSHNSKVANNDMQGAEEEMLMSVKMEKESNEEDPISVKIENEDDSETLTIGKLKVKSFASLTNHQIVPSPIHYNETGTMSPDERHTNPKLHSFPNPRPSRAFNSIALPGSLPPHLPLAINNLRTQLARAMHCSPLKSPSDNSSKSWQKLCTPSRQPSGIESQVTILNVDVQSPHASTEPNIRIPNHAEGASNCRQEIIDVKPDINSLTEPIVKEEVDLEVNVHKTLETSEVANMDIISEKARKDDVYEEKEKNEPQRVRFEHKTGRRSCQGCFFSCDSLAARKRHRETMHSSKSKFVCTVGCTDGTPYQTFNHLVHHVATVHKGEKRWQCRKCGKSYRSKLRYKNHIAPGKCRIVDPYSCLECSFSCITYSELERHQLKHRLKEKLDEEVECPFCNRKLTKRRIKAHVNALHVENDKTFNCDQCDFISNRFYVLKRHYKMTGHNQLYHCLNCNARFVTEEGLMNHNEKCPAIWGPQPAYVCKFEGCTKRFNIESRYETHVKLHSLPEEDFIHCAEKTCDFKCTRRQAMKLHYAKTKHYKPFQCPDCALRYTKESSLSYHISRLHVAKRLNKANALRQTPPVAMAPIDNEEKVDSELVAVANSQNGRSGVDPGEMTNALRPDGATLAIARSRRWNKKRRKAPKTT